MMISFYDKSTLNNYKRQCVMKSCPRKRGTFHSRRWLRDFNPDLCFVSSDGKNQPLPAP